MLIRTNSISSNNLQQAKIRERYAKIKDQTTRTNSISTNNLQKAKIKEH